MYNWCFIGTGKLANKVANQLKKSKRHRVVSCYTRNYEKCQKFAATFGARAYQDVKEAILDPEVDAVYVVTPHNAHYRYVKEALLLNKPVLVEKPFTVFAKETEELIEIAKTTKTYMAEAMWTWFAEPANKVREWIQEGKIGKIKEAYFSWHMLSSYSISPRLFDSKRAGGALLDITVYPLTYAYYLWGYPKRIDAKATMENGIDIKDEIDLYFDDDIKVHITTSIVDAVGGEKMIITGEDGKIDLPLFHSINKVFYKSKNGKEEFKGRFARYFNSIITYLPEFDAVQEDVKNGKLENDKVPLKNTLAVMKMMDEIREQIHLTYDNLE